MNKDGVERICGYKSELITKMELTAKITTTEHSIICIDESDRCVGKLSLFELGRIEHKSCIKFVGYCRVEIFSFNKVLSHSKSLEIAECLILKYIDSYYNHNTLFASNPSKPEQLYKVITNVKGKQISFTPAFKLIH